MIDKHLKKFLKQFIGQSVIKLSNKPFKSGLKTNTVKGIIEHPHLKDEIAFTFEEDDSYVAITSCEIKFNKQEILPISATEEELKEIDKYLEELNSSP